MSMRLWVNGKQLPYLDGAGWVGGRAPVPGDTAVISSAGDGAPVVEDLANGTLLAPNSKDSEIALCSTVVVPQNVFVDKKTYVFVYTKPEPPPSQVPNGDTIIGQTIDLVGAGSATGVVLQKTTLAASTRINVSGLTFVSAAYNNALDGTIAIGLPFTVGGKPVATPPVDAHHFRSELDMQVQAFGSWDGNNGDELTSYVPTTTNHGTILVGASSGFLLELDGNPVGAVDPPGFEVLVPPGRTAFDNQGLISVGAGGQMTVYSADGIYGARYAVFINNGDLTVTGASGATTSAAVLADVTGNGTIDVNGGGHAPPTRTYIRLDDPESGQHFVVSDGAVVFNTNGNVGSASHAYEGGSFTFADHAGVLGIAPKLLLTSLVGVFAVPISGFSQGDHIEFGVMPISTSVASASFASSWDATHHLLKIVEHSVDLQGTITSGLAAEFTLNGRYTSADFTVASTWNGAADSPFDVTITTTAGTTAGAAARLADVAPDHTTPIWDHVG